MPRQAPDLPTTDTLHQQYPLSEQATAQSQNNRAYLSTIITGGCPGFIGIIGPCAMTPHQYIIAKEGSQLYEATEQHPGLYIAHRTPFWKPRTDPADWHGMETEPETVEQAFQIISGQANRYGNVAAEVGNHSHIARYAGYLVFGWNGSRNAGGHELVDNLATAEPTLPIGIKNAMDGTVDVALQHIAHVAEIRGETGAPAVLIYRGGTEAQTPKSWERYYRDALERTEGRVIVDVAHGSSIAFNQTGGTTKTEAGQIACMERVIELAVKCGELPIGMMVEASAAPTPTDPVIAPEIALASVLRLHELRMRAVQTTSKV
ncbi:MAG TPA: hypothetical protein VFT53_06135 [Candidatus Saccharimonadales bacterium]|nr:hypothetical protein [Candidatus Saccharimonadales bacterium]